MARKMRVRGGEEMEGKDEGGDARHASGARQRIGGRTFQTFPDRAVSKQGALGNAPAESGNHMHSTLSIHQGLLSGLFSRIWDTKVIK